jgi:hypothetical protein
MAHPVPAEGDTVEVTHSGTTEDGKVLEASGSYARVELDSGDEVEARHESQAADGPTYVIVEAAGDDADSGEDEADDADEEETETDSDLALDPSEHSVRELEEAVEDVDDAAEVVRAIEVEEQGEDRTTAVEALQRRLSALESDE